jgi:hypothetical protein
MGYFAGMKNNTPIVSAAALLALLALLTGCESWFRAPSPVDGRPLTASELASEQRKIEAQQRTEETAIKTEARAAEERAKTARELARRSFERAAALVKSDAERKMAEAQAEFDAAQDVANRAIAELAATVENKLATIAADRERFAADFEAARSIIEEKRANVAAIVGAGEQVAGGFGPAGGALAAGIGLFGTLFGIKARRDAESTRLAAARVVDAIDVLKERDPAVAASFRANGKLLNEWMGTDGARLVNDAQKA